MANDIQAAKSANPVKNGTGVVSCTFTGEYSTLETSVRNYPTIADIQSKYDARWDERTYYTSGDIVDGGPA